MCGWWFESQLWSARRQAGCFVPLRGRVSNVKFSLEGNEADCMVAKVESVGGLVEVDVEEVNGGIPLLDPEQVQATHSL